MKSNNILILCGHYSDEKYSNSICVKNLAECFVNHGHNVVVIAWGECESVPLTSNGVEVNYIKEPQYPLLIERINKKGGIAKILFKVIHLVRSLILLPFYPNVTPRIARLYFSKADAIIKNNRIDVVLATYTPFDGIWAGIKLKRKYGDSISLVTYHLDLMSSPDNEGFVKALKVRRSKRAFKSELDTADKVLLPENINVEKNAKLSFVGFPLYIKNTNCGISNFTFPTDCINLTYIGSLSKSNRDPSYAIKMIEKLSVSYGIRVMFHVWGIIGDKACADSINSSIYVKYHGTIKNEEVPSILSKSDFLVNISNKITYKMMPSKIFQYFAIGRPILDFVSNENDVSLPFFEKYPASFVIKEYEQKIDDIGNSVYNFITTNKDKTVEMADDVFMNYMPETICNKILN